MPACMHGNGGFDSIAAELFQRGHALVAIDHQVTVRGPGGHHDDGRLLAAVSQRGQQSTLPLRLTDSQMFPSPGPVGETPVASSPAGQRRNLQWCRGGLNNKIRVVTRRSYGFRTYKLWNSPFITTSDAFRHQNHPTDSAEKAFFDPSLTA